MSFLDYINPFKTVASSVERIASEYIETNKEDAEAKAIYLKAMDPNGKMRLEVTRGVLSLYKLYIVVMLFLITMEFFNFVPSGTDHFQMVKATQKLTDLFTPITTMASIVVSASFGVNWQNSKNEKRGD